MERNYSHVPLTKKLNIQSTTKLIILNAPTEYKQFLKDESLKIQTTLTSNAEFIHFFTKNRHELEEMFPKFKKALSITGILWISWPKKAAKQQTDLDENIVMQIGLANGLVDVKVVSIDDTWSALKFIYRLKDR